MRTWLITMWLGLEFCLLFIALPVGLAWRVWDGARPPLIPILLLAFAGCLLFLLIDRNFNNRDLWRLKGLPPEVQRIAVLFAAAALGMAALVLLTVPEQFLAFPRRAPNIWLFVMLLYPIFSVYPQELIYRTFLFHRYREIFRSQMAMIVASAVAFGLMHAVFLHPLSVVLTIAGGFLFAWTYARSRSTFAVSVEHALYGCFVFTIGLGHFFFSGAAFQRSRDDQEGAAEAMLGPLHRVDPSLDPVVGVLSVSAEWLDTIAALLPRAMTLAS